MKKFVGEIIDGKSQVVNKINEHFVNIASFIESNHFDPNNFWKRTLISFFFMMAGGDDDGLSMYTLSLALILRSPTMLLLYCMIIFERGV